jgi:polysaccharide biosynthesis transport protein
MNRSKHRRGPGGGGFGELLAVVRRRRWTVLVVPVLVTGTAVGLSILQPRVYQSRVEVLVKPIPPAPASSQSAAPVNMRTEASVMSSRDVASAAAARLAMQPNPDELLGRLTVTPDEGSAQVLNLAYASSNPREAQHRAQAFAEGYLEVRRKLALDDLATSARAVQSQIVALQGRLQGVDAQIAAAPGRAQRQSLQSVELSMVGELSGLQSRLVQLTPPEPAALAGGQILLPADLPAVPVKPVPVRNALMAIVVGLVLATGTAFLRERLDDRVWGREPVEAELGAPLLAALPAEGGTRRPLHGGPASPALDPGSPPTEAYRKLRAALAAATAGGGTMTLMVTSAVGEDGKTAVTANVAAAFSLAGRRVTAVSADRNRPCLHELLPFQGGAATQGQGPERWGVPEGGDAGSSLRAERLPATGVRAAGIGALELVETGSSAGSPVGPLGPVAVERLVGSMQGREGLVLIDAPPILGIGDAAALTPMVDGLLFVAVAGRTRRRALEQARRELDRMGVKVIGSVLTNVEAGRSRPGW